MQSSKQKQKWNYGACDICDHESSVVPTLNLSLTANGTRGNPYRGYCLECEKWSTMCSRSDYFEHPDPHILHPHSSLKDGDVRPISATEFEIEGQQVRRGDRVVFAPRHNYTPFSERSDESSSDDLDLDLDDQDQDQDQDEPADPDEPETEPDTASQSDENAFNCPECGAQVFGRPDECPHCSAGYRWNQS